MEQLLTDYITLKQYSREMFGASLQFKIAFRRSFHENLPSRASFCSQSGAYLESGRNPDARLRLVEFQEDTHDARGGAHGGVQHVHVIRLQQPSYHTVQLKNHNIIWNMYNMLKMIRTEEIIQFNW